MRENLDRIAELLLRLDTAALCCHVSPDGDTIGSALALYGALVRLGKHPTVFCVDKVPNDLTGLPNAEKVRDIRTLGPEERFDLLLPVDVSDCRRMGKVDGIPVWDLLRPCCGADALIDHHRTNPGFCAVNCIDGDAPAAGLIIRELLPLLGVSLDADLASCLYAAIATDTGNLSYPSTTAEAFRVMAELLEAGLDLPAWNRRLFVLRPAARVKLTARAASQMRLYHGDRIAVLTVRNKDFEECQALPEHTDGIVNQGLSVEGVCMACLLRDSADGVKVSLRCVNPYRIDRVAERFQGGGHAQAAGFTMPGPIDACIAPVLSALEEELDRQS